MRRLVALLAVVLLASGCTGEPAQGTPPAFGFRLVPADERKPAPAIAQELLDGSGTFTLADHRGDVVVVNFWASWCGPCVAEAAELEQAYQVTKGDHVTFLGVNTRGDDRDAAKAFVANHKPTYPNVFDPTGKIALGFDDVPTSVPATLVLDRQGRVAAVALGAVIQSTLEPVVTQLAAEAG